MKNSVKKPKRIEHEIEKLAKTDLPSAIELALYGRQRTPTQHAVYSFLLNLGEIKRHFPTDKHKNTAEYRVHIEVLRQNAQSLSKIFLDAVETGDTETLRIITKEVEDFACVNYSYDSMRSGILCIKAWLDSRGETMTIPKLAALLKIKNAGDTLNIQTGKFEYLREVAKKLNFPMAKTGRPKGR
jgi:hypothetical protein